MPGSAPAAIRKHFSFTPLRRVLFWAPMKKELFDVCHVEYMSYEEMEQFGDKPREKIATGLSLAEAWKLVERLGFGYSIHPIQ